MNLRSHAFLTLLTHAVNEGIRTRRFDPAAPNRNPMDARTSVLFDAPLGSIPMRVNISDWLFDEARVAVAAWPTPDVDRWIENMNAKELAGDFAAIGYLERKNGWVMLANPFSSLVFMRQKRHAVLLGLSMPTNADEGLQLYSRTFNFADAA